MSGRAKIRVYQYDFNGKFLKAYDSISEVREKYFPEDNGKRPLFGTHGYNKEYKVLSDNTIITTKRIGREAIKLIIRIENSKYINRRSIDKREIECYNIKGELLAIFTSAFAATVLLDVSLSMISRHLNSDGGNNKELTFKYKV